MEFNSGNRSSEESEISIGVKDCLTWAVICDIYKLHIYMSI